jgi:hypothetical protein
MKAGNLLFSAVQFVFSVLIILLGGFFIGLQYAVHLRYSIAHFFSHTTLPFSLLGYLILSCGVLLLLGFYIMHRGVYFKLKMDWKSLQIDPAIIQAYVQAYWKQIFPEQNLSIEIRLTQDQQIEMFVELPLLPPDQHQVILEKAEEQLSQILSKQLGYRRDFLLSVLVK